MNNIKLSSRLKCHIIRTYFGQLKGVATTKILSNILQIRALFERFVLL